jgi:hypothetical protein
MNIGHVGHNLCPACEDDRAEVERLEAFTRTQADDYEHERRQHLAEIERLLAEKAEIARAGQVDKVIAERMTEEFRKVSNEVERLRGFWEDSQVQHAKAALEVERLRAENERYRFTFGDLPEEK